MGRFIPKLSHSVPAELNQVYGGPSSKVEESKGVNLVLPAISGSLRKLFHKLRARLVIILTVLVTCPRTVTKNRVGNSFHGYGQNGRNVEQSLNINA